MPMLLAFFTKPLVKYLGGAILIGLLCWFAVHKWNNFKEGLVEEGRQLGREEVTIEFENLVADNNETNRKVEQKVEEALSMFTDGLDRTLNRVRQQTQVIERDIGTTIIKQPEIYYNEKCETPKDMLDLRNGIRRLGPKSANGEVSAPIKPLEEK